MKRSKFSEEQMAYAPRRVESGTPVGDVCRQQGVSEATFYAWKEEVHAPGRERAPPPAAARGRKRALKRLVADLTLDKHMLSEALGKNV